MRDSDCHQVWLFSRVYDTVFIHDIHLSFFHKHLIYFVLYKGISQLFLVQLVALVSLGCCINKIWWLDRLRQTWICWQWVMALSKAISASIDCPCWFININVSFSQSWKAVWQNCSLPSSSYATADCFATWSFSGQQLTTYISEWEIPCYFWVTGSPCGHHVVQSCANIQKRIWTSILWFWNFLMWHFHVAIVWCTQITWGFYD